jgi:hypothetical protein
MNRSYYFLKGTLAITKDSTEKLSIKRQLDLPVMNY